MNSAMMSTFAAIAVLLVACSGKCPSCPPCPSPCAACPPAQGEQVGEIYGKVSIKCGKDVYVVTTGTKRGKCTTSKGADGQIESAGCVDGENSASASCKNGVGACEGATGAGECNINPGKD